jgi:hypothetical protein
MRRAGANMKLLNFLISLRAACHEMCVQLFQSGQQRSLGLRAPVTFRFASHFFKTLT